MTEKTEGKGGVNWGCVFVCLFFGLWFAWAICKSLGWF